MVHNPAYDFFIGYFLCGVVKATYLGRIALQPQLSPY